MTPHLLLIATGARAFREYLLKSIGPEYRVHLFTTAEPSWERPHLAGWTVLPDTLDAAAMITVARRHPESFDGVLCWDEARIQAAAEVATALGLPGPTPDAVAAVRDKHRTRTALARAGVPQPVSVLVGTVDEAVAAARRIKYPVVLKPRALAASLGVVLVRDDAELARHFTLARDTTVPGAPHHDVAVLVEAYATGPEISVDAAVVDGELHVLCVARKEIGYPPYFEEVGHTVDAADPLGTDPALLAVLRDAHAAVGFSGGVTHTELRLTARGPVVIEINGRIGGDLIPYLGRQVSGIDVGLVAAALACGRTPVVGADRKLVGAVRFVYPAHAGIVRSVGFAPTPARVDRAVVLAEPGQACAPPPDGTAFGRVALVTAVADSAEECRVAVQAGAAALRIDVSR